jgi:tetratricopeptide (TPR) repeat protein
VETASGEAVYGASEIAADSTQILAAIARLSAGIRRNVGESIATIRASDSLYRFTTPSFPALRKHMLGTRAFLRGDYTTAAALEQEAIALDSTFAYAHLEMWVTLTNAGLPGGRGIRPLLRAFEMRDHSTDWERYAVEGAYNLDVLGDVPQAIASFRRHLEALNQLSVRPAGFYANLGEALELGGDPVAGRHVLEEARAHHPTAVNQAVLVRLIYSLGDQSAARRVLDEAARRYPDHPALLAERVHLLADSGRYEEAHALAGRIPRDLGLQSGLRLQAEVDALCGRFDEAARHLRDLEEIMSARGEESFALELAAAVATLRLAAGDSSALSRIDGELVHHPLKSIDVYSRPYLALARLYAAANRTGRAALLLRDYEREYPARFRGPDRWLLLRARASIDRAEGKTQQAITDLQEAQHVPPIRLGLFDEGEIQAGNEPELARLYEQLGARDSAIAVYERYLSARSLDRVRVDAIELAPTLSRLAVLYEQRGDRATAARYYRQFAASWHMGDPVARRRATVAERRASMLAPSAASR